MSLRTNNLVMGEYFHIYNRGNGKSEIFKDKEDYDRFMKLLYVCNSEKNFKFRDAITDQKIGAYDFERGEPLVSILSWVLMPNHFHIFIISHRQGLWEKGSNPITKFLLKLSTAYAMYFNKKYQRTGSLFEGKYKSQIVKAENQFMYLFSYIHLNSVKLIQSDWKECGIRNPEKALEFFRSYAFSSFQDYFGQERKEHKILNKELIPEYIKDPHPEDLFDWIKKSQV